MGQENIIMITWIVVQDESKIKFLTVLNVFISNLNLLFEEFE